MNEVLTKFHNLSKDLNVLVVGETIIDEFIEVEYEGQSMKSFCPVFKLTNNNIEKQFGGAKAIARHLSSFVKEVDTLTNSKNEIVKTRYIDVNNGQKHIEINRFETSDFKPLNINSENYDVIIIADFGHGFCNDLKIDKPFYLMSQTNSNNFGFNRVSKWKKYKKKGVCIDLREASLQMNRKFINPTEQDIRDLYSYELNADELFVTLGKRGSIYFDGVQFSKHPIFKSNVIDTIGAGDAYFGFSCIASHLSEKLPLKKSFFIPSLAASLSTTWVCNQEEVTLDKLINHLSLQKIYE